MASRTRSASCSVAHGAVDLRPRCARGRTGRRRRRGRTAPAVASRRLLRRPRASRSRTISGADQQPATAARRRGVGWRGCSSRRPSSIETADARGVGLQALVGDRAQDGAAGGAAGRVGPVGVEEHARRHALGHLAARHHGRDREPVSDALGHDDDVGHHVVRLEPPEVVAGAREPGLHLVHDQQAAGGAHLLGRAAQVPLRQLDDAAVPLDGLRDEAGDGAAGVGVERPVQLLQVGPGVGAERAAVRVRADDLHVAGRRRDQLARLADAGRRLRAVVHAVVRVAQREQLVVARVGAGDEHGEVHGLGAAVDEVRHPVRSLGQGGDQLLREVPGLGMVVRRRDVRQLLHLLAHRREDAGVRVARR